MSGNLRNEGRGIPRAIPSSGRLACAKVNFCAKNKFSALDKKMVHKYQDVSVN